MYPVRLKAVLFFPCFERLKVPKHIVILVETYSDNKICNYTTPILLLTLFLRVGKNWTTLKNPGRCPCKSA